MMKEIDIWINDLTIVHRHLIENSIFNELTDEQKKIILDNVKDLHEKYKPKCQRCFGTGIVYGQYLCRECVVFK